MRKPAARHLAVTTALVLGAFGASMAVAQWTTTGTGTSQATARTAVALTVAAEAGAADLYPGFTGGDVSFTVTNPNPYPVTLTGASFSTVTSSDTGSCPSSNVTVLASKSGLSLAVAAGATTSHVVTDVVTMVSGAPDGCQSKSFSIVTTLTGAQS